jgi:lysosomal alpha-mannosidase
MGALRLWGAVVTVLVAAVAVAVVAAAPQQRANLTAYLIAHSHQDAGWLKTIDQYYEEVRGGNLAVVRFFLALASANVGTHTHTHTHARTRPCVQEVKDVYNTVVEQLGLRADRKFIIVEMVFFSRWFNEASDEERAAVRTYVANGKVGRLPTPWVLARMRARALTQKPCARSSLCWAAGA